MCLMLDVHHPGRQRSGRRPVSWPGVVLAALLLGARSAAALAGDTAGILFVSSHTSTHYLHFIEVAKQVLRDDGALTLTTTELSASQLINGTDLPADRTYDVVVSLGTQAAQALQYRQPQAPVVYALIPQTTYRSLEESGRLACPRGLCTAVYIDQPLPRLLDVLRAAFGDRSRAGVLLGPTSAQSDDELAQLAGRRKLSLHTARIATQDELLPALDRLLGHSDVLLSIPDPVVYNRQTTKSVLLTTYRYRVPVLAYSKAYADAGAALSVYSTPAQIARQTAGIIKTFVNNGKHRLPPPQYPARYRIRINRHVADSLGLELENKPELRSLINDAKDADDEKTEYTE